MPDCRGRLLAGLQAQQGEDTGPGDTIEDALQTALHSGAACSCSPGTVASRGWLALGISRDAERRYAARLCSRLHHGRELRAAAEDWVDASIPHRQG